MRPDGLGGKALHDVKISAGTTLAWTLTFIVVVGLVVAWAIDSDHVGRCAVATSAAAATAHIRQYFVIQNHLLKNAFELGRDSADGRRLH